MYELMVESSFDAAHQLIGYDGPCEQLHGHSWRVQAYLTGGKLNKIGVVEDFKKLKANLAYVIGKLDHTNLNVLPFFKKANPTSENVAKYVYDEYVKRIGKSVALSKITVFESTTSSASYIK